jgi:hypothetical protein
MLECQDRNAARTSPGRGRLTIGHLHACARPTLPDRSCAIRAAELGLDWDRECERRVHVSVCLRRRRARSLPPAARDGTCGGESHPLLGVTCVGRGVAAGVRSSVPGVYYRAR